MPLNSATKVLDLQAGATLTLTGGTKENPKIYYFSKATMNGNAELRVNGYAIFYTDGTLDLAGGTVVNNGGAGKPENLILYSSGSSSTNIKINGGAGFSGAIYAPSANITFSGGGNIYGAVVGGKVTMGGNSNFHYDEALGEVGLIAFFEVAEWIEKPSPS
jgi:choice-of-anchor A domain-containing protein